MPTQDRVRADQQLELPQYGAGERVQEGGQSRPVGGLEAEALVAEVAPQHTELVAQDEDLGVLVVVIARQQPQQREHVCDTEVREAEEHEAASSRSHRHRSHR